MTKIPSSFNRFHSGASGGVFIAAMLALCGALRGTESEQVSLAKNASEAVSADADVAAGAVARLRAAGVRGLDALFDQNAQGIAGMLDGSDRSFAHTPEWRRLGAALDAVGRQHDEFASHLYWYTDFDAAKAAAKAAGKPILSLRLLGNLDEEFSCANSRLFRTVLYANSAVSKRLREHFVLHWESVRPAPKVTIDFGDGRKLERTITGNSIHYVLDPDGVVIDALPGLYGPRAFLAVLTAAEDAAAQVASYSPSSRPALLQPYHRIQLAAEMARWNGDLLKVGAGVQPLSTAGGQPLAAQADRRTISKSAIERPIVIAVGPGRAELTKAAEGAGWEAIAALHLEESALGAASISLIECKSAAADPSENESLSATLSHLQHSLAEDTVRDEYLFHTAIHEWFVRSTAPADLRQLNDKIYTELFLTPRNDPWLGLKPSDTYSALDRDGVIDSAKRQAAK